MTKAHLIIYHGEEEVFNQVVTDMHPQSIDHYIEFDKRRLTLAGWEVQTLRRRITDVSTKPPGENGEPMRVTVWTAINAED